MKFLSLLLDIIHNPYSISNHKTSNLFKLTRVTVRRYLTTGKSPSPALVMNLFVSPKKLDFRKIFFLGVELLYEFKL